MNAQLTINRESKTAKATVLPPVVSDSTLRDMQERSDAFLANRLRARALRRNCGRCVPVDFAI